MTEKERKLEWVKILELKEWLLDEIADSERDLEKCKNKTSPDIVPRRVIETKILAYKNVLRRLQEVE